MTAVGAPTAEQADEPTELDKALAELRAELWTLLDRYIGPIVNRLARWLE